MKKEERIEFNKSLFASDVSSYSDVLYNKLTSNSKVKMIDEAKSTAKTINTNVKQVSLNEFKKDVNVTSTIVNNATKVAMKKEDFPNEVYSIVAGRYAVAKFGKLLTEDTEDQIIKKIGSWIDIVLDKNEYPTEIGTNKYKFSGISPILAYSEVIVNDTDTYKFTWSSNNAAIKSLNSLCEEFAKYGFNYCKDISAEIAAGGLTQALNLWIKALAYDNSALSDVINALKPYVKFEEETTGWGNDGIKNAIKWLSNLTKELFPNNSSNIIQYSEAYKELRDCEYSLLQDVYNDEGINSYTKSYTNFTNTHNKLANTLGQNLNKLSDTWINKYFEKHLLISDVHNDVITESASVVGTEIADNITIYSSNSNIQGNNGNDKITVNGNKNYVDGGSGQDTILINGSDVTVDGGFHSINLNGKEIIDYTFEKDTFIIGSGAKNIFIKNFEISTDIIILESNTIADEIQTFIGEYDNEKSFVISSSKTGDTIAVIHDVTESNINNIKYPTNDGNTITASIDWLLINKAVKPPVIKPPDFGDNKNNVGTEKADSLNNNIDNIVIEALSGNDTIENSGKNVTINAGDGNDAIYNSSLSNGAYIDGGIGDDKIDNYSKNTTIQGGTGNDSIKNQNNSNVIIKVDSGNNYIYNSNSDSVTISGGTDDDYINISYSSKIKIDSGIGNDRIEGKDSGNNVTITSGDGNDSVAINSQEAIIDSGNGNDSIYNYGSYSSINGGNGNDYIYNSGYNYSSKNENVTIQGGSGKDSIFNYNSSNILIETGEDDNYIYCSNSDNLTINSGIGNDSIIGGNGLIYTNDGDDFINATGTINSGRGNDTIHAAGSLINSGTGNNRIFVTGNNTLTNGGGFDTIEISGWYSSIYTKESNDYISITDYGDKYIHSDGGNNTIVSSTNSSSGFGVIDGTKATIIAIGNGDDVVTVGSGYIDVGNGNNSIFLNNTASSASTIIAGDGNDIINVMNYNYNNFSSLYYNYQIQAGNGNNYINNSNRRRSTISAGNGNDTIITGGDHSSINAGNGNNKIILNTSIGSNTILTGNGNDTITLGTNNELSKSIANTLILISGNDIIQNYNESDTIQSAENLSSLISGNDIILTGQSSKITLKGAKGQKLNIIKNNSISTLIQDNGNGNSPDKNSTTKNDKSTLNVNNSNTSSIVATSKIKAIDASKRTKAIKIVGNTLANSIKGGSGADTIQGGKGADTLTGGKGNDVFVYASGDGKDVITDYTVGQDKIKITSAKISKTSVSGSDVILTVGSGSIKVKNAKGKKLSIYNNSTSMTNTIIGSGSSTSTTLKVTNATKSPITAGGTIKTINASTRTTAVKITGNSLANSIKGGSAADTLIGGKGNDTLTGGNGNDVFVYTNGNGNDVITDYAAKQDKIKLNSSTISSSSIRGSDVVLKIGSGSITVKNGKNKSITVIDSKNKSTSKVYGTSSKNYIEKLWFENDDSVADDEIAAITQQNITSDNKVNNATGQLIHYDTDNILLNNQQITSTIAYNRKK